MKFTEQYEKIMNEADEVKVSVDFVDEDGMVAAKYEKKFGIKRADGGKSWNAEQISFIGKKENIKKMLIAHYGSEADAKELEPKLF